MKLDQELVIIFSARSVSAKEAWLRILAQLSRENSSESTYTVNGQIIAIHDVENMIPSGTGQHFNVQGNTYEFDLTIVGAYAHDAIRVRGAAQTDWDSWLHALKGAGQFVQAYVVNVEYDYWQNASDPLQYIARDVPYQHLPSTSNGLPPPLERTIIDISGNPGRRVLHQGFIEALGSPMWLSEQFFGLSGATSKEVLSANGDFTVRQENGLLRLEITNDQAASPSPRALIQLRKLLFPRAK
ncbi:hypothetical protein [Lysobacter antibioticus]|uniref:hypothetical protein n=1 Tax=Lysobacter antibioticus TaxID=84531 RepID=UPI00114045A8|nr:hypothetical protein [Lysobacter antibioticus]